MQIKNVAAIPCQWQYNYNVYQKIALLWSAFVYVCVTSLRSRNTEVKKNNQLPFLDIFTYSSKGTQKNGRIVI